MGISSINNGLLAQSLLLSECESRNQQYSDNLANICGALMQELSKSDQYPSNQGGPLGSEIIQALNIVMPNVSSGVFLSEKQISELGKIAQKINALEQKNWKDPSFHQLCEQTIESLDKFLVE